MKYLLLFLSACLYGLAAWADTGVPFFVNYPATEYGAHNRNFDVAVGSSGVVYFANFEGLLYYDNDCWHILRTPGYTRVTCLWKDDNGIVWVGGYGFVARVVSGPGQAPVLQPVQTDIPHIGEVTALSGNKGSVYVRNRTGGVFRIRDGRLVQADGGSCPPMDGRTVTRKTVEGLGTVEVNHMVSLRCGWTVLATRRHGLVVTDRHGRKLYALDEDDGLCSNSVGRIADDGHGGLWGVTDNGIFKAYLPSMFTRYTAARGLKGEVTTMARYMGELYMGTLQGLYVARDGKAQGVREISQACWKLQPSPDGRSLYAATTEGVFRIQGRMVTRLSDVYAQTLCCGAEGLYVAGMDGISLLDLRTGDSRRIAGMEHVVALSCDTAGCVTAKTIDGKIYCKTRQGGSFIQTATVGKGFAFFGEGKALSMWTADVQGKNIACAGTGHEAEKMNEKLKPLRGKTVRTILPEGDSVLWVGGDFGVVRVDFQAEDDAYGQMPRLYFRRITVDGDSLLYGGFRPEGELTGGRAGKTAPVLSSDTKEITFRFSTDAATVQGETEYQYQLEGYDKDWSDWGGNTVKGYANLRFGTYTFKVRARDAFGRQTDTMAYSFTIERPFYLQWYSLLAYVLLLFLLIGMAVKWRLRGLIRDKERLEGIVAERTADLRRAQENLLRQEKLAAVGKLTNGLIDRILNPLNYINNFSHLSFGLAKDLGQTLESLKGRMSDEEYEDADDLLRMLCSNLAKIERHGGNISRILKAMEEIMRERHRTREWTDITAICRQSEGFIQEYYRDEITRMGIRVSFRGPEDGIWVEGNGEQLGKILMSLISNSIYAISRKYARQAYEPEITLTAETEGNRACIRLKDNGTGIEPAVIDRIFDPFFTTKTTGEAAGVGLYLSREIITDYGGSISADSSLGEFTEFTITLPLCDGGKTENDRYVT